MCHLLRTHNLNLFTKTKGKNCHAKVSYFDNNGLTSSGLGILDRDFLFLCSDHLNRLHELVGDDGYTDEEVDHEDDVQKAAAESGKKVQWVQAVIELNDVELLLDSLELNLKNDFYLLEMPCLLHFGKDKGWSWIIFRTVLHIKFYYANDS